MRVSANARTSSGPLSEEPSSSTISSQSTKLCASTEQTAARMVAAALRMDNAMLTIGIGSSAKSAFPVENAPRPARRAVGLGARDAPAQFEQQPACSARAAPPAEKQTQHGHEDDAQTPQREPGSMPRDESRQHGCIGAHRLAFGCELCRLRKQLFEPSCIGVALRGTLVTVERDAVALVEMFQVVVNLGCELVHMAEHGDFNPVTIALLQTLSRFGHQKP